MQAFMPGESPPDVKIPILFTICKRNKKTGLFINKKPRLKSQGFLRLGKN